MKLRTICAATMALLMTTACAMREIRPIADSACLAFSEIRYAVPPVQTDGTRNVAIDEGNRYDTTETVADLQEHNVRYRATCSGE